MSRFQILTGLAIVALTLCPDTFAAPRRNQPSIVSQAADGKLVYDADEKGNVVPDFSYCGYAKGERPIPIAPVRVVVPPSERGDQTAEIQKAINYVASLPLDTNGLRGAVLLLKGLHPVNGGLLLDASGVVLRGQGMNEDGTVLAASGPDRHTLIRIVGRKDRKTRAQSGWQIKDDYVPVGANCFELEDAGGLKAGDAILVTRPSSQQWINDLSATEFGGGFGDWRFTWRTNTRDVVWDRVVKSVDGNRVTVDAPITTALEKKYGGGRVEVYEWPGRITNVGVENLRCLSLYDDANPKDENHPWMAVTMENAADCWVRRVTAKHFASSLVSIFESCKCVTVEDCISLEPVSEEGGYRRLTFFTMGQMTLFLRCSAERGWHDFSAGWCAPGPNAFVQCEASLPLRDSGPIESWSSGVLYDNLRIDGGGLTLADRGGAYTGSGWAAANCVLWQCSASQIRCESPPTAQNWAFGCWGEFAGNGIWRGANNFVNPESLYLGQLADRLGRQSADRIPFQFRMRGEFTNPTEEVAAQQTILARKPMERLREFIVASVAENPIPSAPGAARSVGEIPDTFLPPTADAGARKKISIVNGWVVCDGKLLMGRSQNIMWWRGNIRPSEATNFGPCLTRFVPGRTGRGYTDDLNELADDLIAAGSVSLDHHYGLWYERRRDDHERVRRVDGDVWPPFYEQAFARSGQGTAWEGLSRYDLTKYNPWYWGRLKEFADICDRRGLVLFNENFFQHNIIEAGAHWVDCPWRTANNVNNTGFPEPPLFAGDKRIFMAEQFYDVSNPVRRPIYRAYIRQCLDNFKDNANVIQFTSAEYTGPLHFMQFWLDTVGEWERETGHHSLIALSCTKDVQDAILADPQRREVVDLIEFKYWWETSLGLFAPQGGLNLAPRQFERRWRGGRPTDMDLAKMAAEYREKFPDKAVISDFASGGWAFVCAGGSIPNIPGSTDPNLLMVLPRMKPVKSAGAPAGQYTLAEPGKNYLVYSESNALIRVDLTGETGRFFADWVNLESGKASPAGQQIRGGGRAEMRPPALPNVLWLHR